MTSIRSSLPSAGRLALRIGIESLTTTVGLLSQAESTRINRLWRVTMVMSRRGVIMITEVRDIQVDHFQDARRNIMMPVTVSTNLRSTRHSMITS